MTQDEINAALVEHGAAGRRVVRLKGGDPFVFGRGGEEAAGARGGRGRRSWWSRASPARSRRPPTPGIPVTHRGVATSFTVVTGHEDPAKPSEQTDWAALARVPGTLVMLMGMGRLAAIAEALVAGGRPADEPAAAVQWGTTPRQRSVVATLGDDRRPRSRGGRPRLAGRRRGGAGRGPGRRDRRGSSGGRSPAGAVVVTRARAQASELSDRLRDLGAAVVELPAIRIAPLPDGPGIERRLRARWATTGWWC